MSQTLKTINNFIYDSQPNTYGLSYSTYLRNLATISNTYIDEKEKLKAEVAKIEDEKLRLKLLELI